MKTCYLVLLAFVLQPVFPQQCQQVTVCSNNETQSMAAKGEKGEAGMRGKAGPVGLNGDKGLQGESCALGSFGESLMGKIRDLETLLIPASCRLSSVDGKQTLRSGDVVVCDNGWTVFHRRFANDVDFNLLWAQYKDGFGDLDGDFWFGLDKIHNRTKNQGCRLRVDLWDQNDDHSYAEYSDFYVEDESDNYRLHLANYSGTAGDGLIATSEPLDKVRFSTRDRDNDETEGNCARSYPGGWWFHSCFVTHLNRAPPTMRWNQMDTAKATMKVRCD